MGNRFGNTRQPFDLLSEKVADEAARESFDRARQFFDGMLMSRFEGDHFEVTFNGPGTVTYPHNFRFVPKDLWITSQKGDPGSVYVNYNAFDSTNFEFLVSGISAGESITIRFFAGVFVNEI